jgi:CheY-like chemotaxis protein
MELMNRICAWCQTPLDGQYDPDALISHGICARCVAGMERTDQALPRFLESLPGAVMMVDSNVRAVAANTAFAAAVHKHRAWIPGQLGGDIISCTHARLPGGCGQTTECAGCPIRGTVTDAHTTQEPRADVRAHADIESAEGLQHVFFHLSVQPIGEHVLVRVDGSEPAPGPRVVPRPADSCKPTTIVVADDDEALRKSLSRFLIRNGYRVVEAVNGVEAFERAMADDVDMLLTDLAMPEQEGIETMMRLRRHRSELAVVAMSGAFDGECLPVARLLGADRTLAKPIVPDHLLTAIHDALAIHRVAEPIEIQAQVR